MTSWPCDWDNCRQPAVQRAGDCLLCDKHLCRTHLQDQWHKCPKPETNWEDYSAKYGIPCSIDVSTKNLSAMMGGQNCHAEITFQDNVKWLAWFRLTKTSSPPVIARDYVLQSEAATMKFLRKDTRIPSPEVFDWACESDPQNPVGRVGYILMEKVEGKPLKWHLATSSQKEKVMQQLVDIFLGIEKHPFDTDSHIHATFRPGNGGPLGPFNSARDAASSIIRLYLDMIMSGEITAEYPIDVYLVRRYRLDVLAKFGEELLSEGQLFLKHPDDKGDHILVNEAYDIVGIIDWEWCCTASKEEAFSSPCMIERSRDDLAGYVTKGRKIQRFLFALGAASECQNDYETFINLFPSLKRAFEPDEEEG
ncbi:hypothetical protein F4802DRAFT_610915 [Xylaria palmicola]|nr:hypothetical protein F4802DRAFT_610915 [Xylaria palmicola]